MAPDEPSRVAAILGWAASGWPGLAAGAVIGALVGVAVGRWAARRARPGGARPQASASAPPGGVPPGGRPSTGYQRRIGSLEARNLELVRLFVLLPDLARDLSATTDRAEIIKLLVERTQGLFPEAACVGFFGPPEEPGMPLSVAAVSRPPALAPDGGWAGVPQGKGVVGQAFASGETLTHGRLRQRLSTFELQEALANDPTPFPVWAAVPLLHQGAARGVLTIAHPGPFWVETDPDAPDPLKLLGVVADVGAITLEHAGAVTELARVNAELQQLDRLKSEFLSMVSHDLRTPLTSVSSALQNLVDGVAGDLNERQVAYLGTMRGETDRLVRLINALLDLQRIEAGAVGLSRVRVHMRPLVERTLRVLRTTLEERGIRVDLAELAPDLEAPADPDRLSQVLFNLLDNACKFTPAGGRIVLQGQVRGDLVVVGVTNTGPVVTPEEAEVMFERFRQLRTEGAPRPKGAGLGLSIARRLVEMHGGAVWARGIPGTGTRVAFSLPAFAQSPAPEAP